MGTLSQHFTGNPKAIYPSSLRPGAATHFFEEWGENVQRLMWRGRWTCQRTLEHYIQELMTHQVLQTVSAHQMTAIDGLSALLEELLTASRR